MKKAFFISAQITLLAVVLLLAAGSIVQPAQGAVSIPQGATVTSATMMIAKRMDSFDFIEVHRVTAPWDEATVSWNSFAAAYSPEMVARFVPDGKRYTSVDVTEIVQDWVNGAPNYGLLMKGSGLDYSLFSSSEYRNPPSLVVCYQAASEKSCVTISGSNAVDDAAIWALPGTRAKAYGSDGALFVGYINGYEKQSLVRFHFGLTTPSGSEIQSGDWKSIPTPRPDGLIIGGLMNP